MVSIATEKLNNSYLIETKNYDNVKKLIHNIAISKGFDKDLVLNNSHPDIICIESPDELIKIENVRENIIDKLCYAPKLSDYKFYIIYDAVHLMENSQNTLLKSLEEPPMYVVFFLVTSNAKMLLPTVRSRCIQIYDNEDIDYSALSKDEKFDMYIKFLADYKYQNISEIMSFLKDFEKDDVEYNNFIMINRVILRDVLYYKTTLDKKMLYLRDKADDIILIASGMTYKMIGNLIDKLNYLSELKNSQVNKRIALFNFYNM